MRLSARDITFKVATEPDSIRPIRLRTGSMSYCMDLAEALDLANQLADAVDDLNAHKRTTP